MTRLPRVVSLVPSVTDTLVALGAAATIVGISADCDQPDGRRPVPVVTRPAVDPAVAADEPAAADEQVRALLGEGADLYSVDLAMLAELRPDVLFGQDSCAVCAVPTRMVADELGRRGRHVAVHSVDPDDLGGVLESFEQVGAAVGMPSEGAELAARSAERLALLAPQGHRPAGSADPAGPAGSAGSAGPRVVVLDWLDPLFAAGNWVAELIVHAGGSPVLAEAGRPSRQLEFEELVRARPQRLVAAPCGVELDGAAAAVRRQPALGRAGMDRVLVLDGRRSFSRPGPRLVEAAAVLAAWLRTGEVPAGSAIEAREVEVEST